MPGLKGVVVDDQDSCLHRAHYVPVAVWKIRALAVWVSAKIGWAASFTSWRA
ncbi:MAG: hypothetical protein ACLP4R_04435 [Solirubrobacteraceae bacterium]